jgi:hypothetical protein
VIYGDIKPEKRKQIVDFFNDPYNLEGQYVKVLIGALVMSESFNLHAVREAHILTYSNNYGSLNQVLARCIRTNSHVDLPESDRNVKIFIYASCVQEKPSEKSLSIEEIKYLNQEKYYLSIKKIERFMKEVAYDCYKLHDMNVRQEYKDYTEACDFEKCNYHCEVSPGDIEKFYKHPDASTYFMRGEFIEMELIEQIIRYAFRQLIAWSYDSLVAFIHKVNPLISIENIYMALYRINNSLNPLYNTNHIPGRLDFYKNYIIFVPINGSKNLPLDERFTVENIFQSVSISLNKEPEEAQFNLDDFIKRIEGHSTQAKVDRITSRLPNKEKQYIIEDVILSVQKTAKYSEKFTRFMLMYFKDYLITEEHLDTSQVSSVDILTIIDKYPKHIIGHFVADLPRCLDFTNGKWTDCDVRIYGKPTPKADMPINPVVLGFLDKDRAGNIVFKILLPSTEEVVNKRHIKRGLVCNQLNDKELLISLFKKLGKFEERYRHAKIRELCGRLEIELRQRKTEDQDYQWFYDYMEYKKLKTQE